ncbi:MAG: DUF362 domain-containing protein [candidate division WOR-3 bacterium]
MKKILTRLVQRLSGSIFWLGLGSILWLLLRSGTKPGRVRYPCQQAAAGTGALWLSAFVFPGVLRGLRRLGLRLPEVRIPRLARILMASAAVIAVALLVVTRFIPARVVQPDHTRAALPAWTSSRPDPSHVFVVDSFPVPDSLGEYHEGLDSLLSLMAGNGTYLYRSAKPLPWCDTSGIVGKNDVVLIKVNAEWPERGMTNTDLIKGLIARIVAHPDTFTGEVQLVENGQWRHSWTYSQNNAERHSQHMQSIVDTFAGRGFRVGAYNWTAIGYGSNNRWVNEFSSGDTVSGYVREDSTGMTYPKFVTSYGTSISTRLGIWNGTTYEPERLKFINMPVLKSHSIMGVTGAVKHYIGFLSYAHIGSSTMHSRAMTQGLLGVDFGKARFPDLNIIDATWVSAEITTGPNAPYGMCTRLNTLVASRDPIAADWFAGKYVIRPASWWNGRPWLQNYGRMDPDNLNTENPGSGRLYSDSTPCNGYPYNAFHQMLVSSRDQMLRYGRQVTMDSAQISVHLFRFPRVGLSDRPAPRPGGNRLNVVPSPTTGRIVAELVLKDPGSVRLLLFSSDGRIVASRDAGRLAAGNHRLELNEPLPPGTYVLTVETSAGRLSRKLVATVP